MILPVKIVLASLAIVIAYLSYQSYLEFQSPTIKVHHKMGVTLADCTRTTQALGVEAWEAKATCLSEVPKDDAKK